MSQLAFREQHMLTSSLLSLLKLPVLVGRRFYFCLVKELMSGEQVQSVYETYKVEA